MLTIRPTVLALGTAALLGLVGCGSSSSGSASSGPPEQVLAEPRTQQFLRRIIDAGRL